MPGGGKLDRWLARQKEQKETAHAPQSAPDDASGTNAAHRSMPEIQIPLDRGKPPACAGPRSPASRGLTGGVGACCNLIRLLDPEELTRGKLPHTF